MLSLEQYILDKSNKYILPDKNGYRTLEEFCDINNIDLDNITEEQIDFYYKWNWNTLYNRDRETFYRNIYETLTSHSKEKLIEKIKQETECESIILNNNNAKNSNASTICVVDNYFASVFYNENDDIENLINKCLLGDTKDSNKLYDILKFFNYYISLIVLNDKYEIYIFCEPEYTKNITKKIKKNGPYIYHITSKDNLRIINKTGLRPKVGKTLYQNGYRYFTSRIYFIYNGKTREETISNIKQIIEDKKLENNYILLRINISDHNMGLYLDTSSKSNLAVYTYESIPKELIEEITIKDI